MLFRVGLRVETLPFCDNICYPDCESEGGDKTRLPAEPAREHHSMLAKHLIVVLKMQTVGKLPADEHLLSRMNGLLTDNPFFDLQDGLTSKRIPANTNENRR